MVSTPLKNIRQIGSCPQIKRKYTKMKPPPSYHVSSTKLGRLVNNNQNLYEVFGCFTLLLFTCSQFWFKFLFVPLPTNRRLLQAQQTASSDHPRHTNDWDYRFFSKPKEWSLRCCLLLLLGKKKTANCYWLVNAKMGSRIQPCSPRNSLLNAFRGRG